MTRPLLAALTVAALVRPLSAAPPDFDRAVVPVLSKCLDCHTGPDAKGDLDLSRKATGLGSVVPGKPADSPLWQRVEADEMPPKKPLTAAEKATLKAWIEGGGAWGTDPVDPLAFSTATRGGRDWWALRPVPPAARPDGNPVDHFVRLKLRDKGLSPAPPADPRTLARRVTLDLTGLPPTPEEVEAFAADPSAAAYERLVDRLLASPRYGERFARHWLDLVRYAESDGFERNAPRPNAWPYRDWVIKSLNDDLRYDEFAKLQLAGDHLRPDDPAAVAATGFLVAGVHNTVLGSNKVANATARQDEVEEMVAAVGQTFLGLTVQCARCHDHKFDAVTQTDYYRLAAALAGVTHGERPARSAAWVTDRKAAEGGLRRKRADLDRRIGAVERAGRERAAGPHAVAVPPVARWTFDADANDSVGGLHATLHGGAKVEGGRLVLDGKGAFASTPPLAADLGAKTLEAWVTLSALDQRGGGVVAVEAARGDPFDAIVFGERQPRRWLAGSEGHRRTKDVAGPAEPAAGKLVHVAVAYAANGSIAVYRDGTPYAPAYTPAAPPVAFKAGDARVLLGKRHTGGTSPFFAGEVDEARLYDTALSPEQVAASAAAGPGAVTVPVERMLAALTADEKADRDRLLGERAKLDAELAALPKVESVFAVVSARPEPTHVLVRGSVEKPAAAVTAGGVAAVGAADFGLTARAADGVRRAKLAAWVARADNPLFTRTAVNRIWQQHFGVGLVDTPSDLGFNGGRPSHPELLDWLAAEFVRQNFSVKAMRRLVVTSATYKQSAARDPKAVAVDADNRLLWRKSPARLEAEVLRDAILMAAGELNLAAGGPGYLDTRSYGAESGTIFYEPLDKFDAATNRRTVYRFAPRGERAAILETFDCPDPSALTPRRQVTTTPLQALALWNDPLVLTMADRFAARVTRERDTTAGRVERAYRLAVGRPPTAAESAAAVGVAEAHGLAAVCRALFNCSEFVVSQ